MMFGFFKNNEHNIIGESMFKNDITAKQQKYFDWRESEDYKRFSHLETLIIKTYETVNIKAELMGFRLNESFTRSDFIEDYKLFFKPEVFDKLKDWCSQYELLREKEQNIMNNL